MRGHLNVAEIPTAKNSFSRGVVNMSVSNFEVSMMDFIKNKIHRNITDKKMHFSGIIVSYHNKLDNARVLIQRFPPKLRYVIFFKHCGKTSVDS